MGQTHDFSRVPVARSWLQRVLGLIGRDSSSLFLLIPQCSAVHTWFMPVPIDIVFLDERGVVVSVATGRPWRIYVGPSTATAVLELPSGRATELGVLVGDIVVLPQKA